MMQLPTDFIHDIAFEIVGKRTLLLVLPGAKNTPRQLVENGFISELRRRKLPVDVLVLDAHADLYLEPAGIERVLHHTLDEVRSHGYHSIWLLGISLGGSGAMICATQRTEEIDGVFLLAPFLGTRGIIAEVEAAGGLHRWQAGEIGSRDYERRLLAQLQNYISEPHRLPATFLGYGSEDKYRGASIMLSKLIPEHRVTVTSGGHDWETWLALWRRLLDKQPFAE
jgi:pimeloyl-ACP methyl ester carboxylesterase